MCASQKKCIGFLFLEIGRFCVVRIVFTIPEVSLKTDPVFV